jgi:hypothetical protein
MNKKILLLSSVFLVFLSAVTYSVRAQTEPTPTPPTAPGTPGTPGTPAPMHRRHQAIRGAIRALELAKAEMQAAAHDYGGHREDAIAACDTAIAQLKLALQYANQNAHSSPTPEPTQ